MGQTLIIAPDQCMFRYTGTEGSESTLNVKDGALALNLDWSEELEPKNISDDLVTNIVNAPTPNLYVAIKTEGETKDRAQSIVALLMSLESYLVAKFSERVATEDELKVSLEDWRNYFKALQQHRYVFGDRFSIYLLSDSVLPEDLQVLTRAFRSALQNNAEANELLEQFESICAADKPGSWSQVVYFNLHQYHALKNATNEISEQALLVDAACKEKEAIKIELKDRCKEEKLHAQKFQRLQSELETALVEVKNCQSAIVELTEQNDDLSIEFATVNEERGALASEKHELSSECKLLLIQTQQLHQELETVFTLAERRKSQVAELEGKNTVSSRQLTEAGIERQDLLKTNKMRADENGLLQLQIQQLQEELESTVDNAESVKALFTDLEHKYSTVNNQLNSAKFENSSLAASNQLQEAENALMSLQILQLQEELEATYEKQVDVQKQLLDSEKKNRQLIEQYEKKPLKSSVDKSLVERLSQLDNENAILVLQIGQLQEELESVYTKHVIQKTTNSDLTEQSEVKVSRTESIKLRKELKDVMSEKELLQLQVKQLREELEFYFSEYQKLKGESPDNKALNDFKNKVENRFPYLVLSEDVTLTGGANQKDFQRITARFTEVSHGDKRWNAFSIIVNNRNGVLDVEFHAPNEQRIYPLSRFVKTGSNKVCDFSLLSPFTDAGKKALAQLSADDHLLLIGIIEELQARLLRKDVQCNDATLNLDLSEWPKMLCKLKGALEQLVPKEAHPPLNFKKLSLKQNMVSVSNEHLLICIENLHAGGVRYPAYDIKVGAKQIKDKEFTDYGSLEFRELANSQAPLVTWPPETEDKWGLKLVLDLPADLNEGQQKAIDHLQMQDKLFIRDLLTKLASRLHTLNRKNLKINQPLENWQKLIAGMVSKFE